MRVSGAGWRERVVPLAVPVVAVEWDLVHLDVGDLLAGGVPVGVVDGVHGEPGLGGDRVDELDDEASVGHRWIVVIDLGVRCLLGRPREKMRESIAGAQ